MSPVRRMENQRRHQMSRVYGNSLALESDGLLWELFGPFHPFKSTNCELSVRCLMLTHWKTPHSCLVDLLSLGPLS